MKRSGHVTNIEKKKNLISRLKFFLAQEYFHKKIILGMLGIGFLANFLNWLSLWIWIEPVDLPIILHYNVYFGVDSMGHWKQAFILPAIGLSLWIVNVILAGYFFENKERIAAYLLLIANIMIQFSLLIASVSIIIINY